MAASCHTSLIPLAYLACHPLSSDVIIDSPFPIRAPTTEGKVWVGEQLAVDGDSKSQLTIVIAIVIVIIIIEATISSRLFFFFKGRISKIPCPIIATLPPGLIRGKQASRCVGRGAYKGVFR